MLKKWHIWLPILSALLIFFLREYGEYLRKQEIAALYEEQAKLDQSKELISKLNSIEERLTEHKRITSRFPDKERLYETMLRKMMKDVFTIQFRYRHKDPHERISLVKKALPISDQLDVRVDSSTWRFKGNNNSQVDIIEERGYFYVNAITFRIDPY